MNSRAIGILVLAVFFSVIENAYFGWNWSPQSEAELICDGIAMLLFALGILAGGKDGHGR